MSHILNAADQQDYLTSIVGVTLGNFSMASRVADLLITYGTAQLPPPTATVHLGGRGPSVDIPGTSCGFFTTPVIGMAVLDCRRSLEFFGLTCDHTRKCLTPIEGRRPDDMGIKGFGLALVAPQQFLLAASTVIAVPLEPILVEIHRWSNKQLAHFTTVKPTVTLQSIRTMSVAMLEAYSQLLFAPLGRPRPSINPSPS